jgi:hypothetical protein
MPPKKPSPKEVLRKKIADIHKAILRAESNLRDSKNLDKDIDKSKSVLLVSINELRDMARQHGEAAAAISIEDEIERLVQDAEFPNLRQQNLHSVQQQARDAAAEVVTRWERVTPGVSLNDLTADAKERLMACTTEGGSPFQSVLNAMIQKLEGENKEPLAYLNFAIALFQAMVPQFCGQDIPTIPQVEQNENNVRDLLECIAIVACNKCQEPVNPLAVFGEAAFQRPQQFFKDFLGGGFALGVLAEMVPNTVGLVQQVPSTLFQLGKYMVTNPLASFTTYHVAEPYIKSLLQKVIGDRFRPGQNQVDLDDRRIRELFDELSEHYMREDVTDIIGFPPADIDSVRNRLNQILYHIGYRSVAGLQSTGGIVSAARSFPGELCKRVMSTGSAIKTWLCDNGMRLLERYKFIPQGTEEGLFESILQELDRKEGLLENPHIDAFVIAYLKHNQPTTVFHPSVKYHTARGDLEYKPLLSPHDESSLGVQASQTSHYADDMEDVGPPDGSGTLAEPGGIRTDPNMSSSNGGKLRQFRGDMQSQKLLDDRLQQAARAAEEEEARRLAAGAQGAAAAPASARGGDPLLSSIGANLSGRRSGGRSRSRKSSVSKRTRRKGLDKKQKSNKNKRQSRRKVRRASSRKGRK